MTHTHTHTHGRTPVEEGWASSKDLYPKTHNTHNRQTSMSPAGCKPATPGSVEPQIHALDRAATGIARKRTYRSANIAATEIESDMEVERKLWIRLLKITRYEDGINNSSENFFDTEYILGIVDWALMAPPTRQKQVDEYVDNFNTLYVIKKSIEVQEEDRKRTALSDCHS
jgi:hypothetical protein